MQVDQHTVILERGPKDLLEERERGRNNVEREGGESGIHLCVNIIATTYFEICLRLKWV